MRYGIAAAILAGLIFEPEAQAFAATQIVVNNQVRSYPYQTYEQYSNSLEQAIWEAIPGSTVTVITDSQKSMDREAAEAFTAKGVISLGVSYIDGASNVNLTVPQGKDLTKLLNQDGYIGFRYLNLAYGDTPFESVDNWTDRDLSSFSHFKDSERNFYMGAMFNELYITDFIEGLAKKTGAKLEGLQFRVKSPGSTYEKIYDREDSTSITEMKDIIRYTFIFPWDRLADKTIKVMDEMAAAGYQKIKVRNSWTEDSAYKGVNTSFRAPNGNIVEIQFHTPESLEVKESSHAIYEAKRLLPESSPEYMELDKQARAYNESLKTPANIEKLEDYPKK